MKHIFKLLMLIVLSFSISAAFTSCGDDEPVNPATNQNPTDSGIDSDSDSSDTSEDINDFDYYLGVAHDAPTYYDPDTKEYTYSLTIGFGVENMYSKNLAVFGMIVECYDGEVYTSTDSNDAVRAKKYGSGYYIWDIIRSDKLDMVNKSILVYSKKSSITIKLTPRWQFSSSNNYFEGATVTRTMTPCPSI